MPRTSRSLSTSKTPGTPRRTAANALTAPVHPGEMLREEFLIPLGLSAHALAVAVGVPATRISEIVNERRSITGDTAIRLGEYFRLGPEFWMNLQASYELELARDQRARAGTSRVKPAPVDQHGALLSRLA